MLPVAEIMRYYALVLNLTENSMTNRNRLVEKHGETSLSCARLPEWPMSWPG